MAPSTMSPAPGEVGLGCNKWGVGASFDAAALAETYAAALENGVTLFNTAQAYPTSERCLGAVARGGPRPRIVTKFNSLTMGPAALVASLERSRADLGVAAVDVFLVHFPRGAPAALADALADAVRRGLCRAVGVSNFGEARLREFHGLLAARGVPLGSVRPSLPFASLTDMLELRNVSSGASRRHRRKGTTRSSSRSSGARPRRTDSSVAAASWA